MIVFLILLIIFFIHIKPNICFIVSKFSFMQIMWIFETHGGLQNEQFCSGQTILPMFQSWHISSLEFDSLQLCSFTKRLGPWKKLPRDSSMYHFWDMCVCINLQSPDDVWIYWALIILSQNNELQRMMINQQFDYMSDLVQDFSPKTSSGSFSPSLLQVATQFTNLNHEKICAITNPEKA